MCPLASRFNNFKSRTSTKKVYFLQQHVRNWKFEPAGGRLKPAQNGSQKVKSTEEKPNGGVGGGGSVVKCVDKHRITKMKPQGKKELGRFSITTNIVLNFVARSLSERERVWGASTLVHYQLKSYGFGTSFVTGKLKTMSTRETKGELR